MWCAVLGCLFAAVDMPENDRGNRIVKLDVGKTRVTVDSPPERIAVGSTAEFSVTMLGPTEADVRWPVHQPADGEMRCKPVGSRAQGPDRIDKFMGRRWFLTFEATSLGQADAGKIEIEAQDADGAWVKETIKLPGFEVVSAIEAAGKPKPADDDSALELPLDRRSLLFLAGALIGVATLALWLWGRSRGNKASKST